MDYDLRHRPWTDEGGGLIPEDVFLERVQSALETKGRWETYGEIRMASGPIVSVTAARNEDGVPVYEAEAVWNNSRCLRLSATYETLHHALVALPIIGRALWTALENGAGIGLHHTTRDGGFTIEN
jgi:hypothetical protein